MRREINLSGGEITLLKTMGLSGAPVYGKVLIDHIGEMESAEFVDELNGLIMLGYVLSDKVKEDLKARIPLGRMGCPRDVAAAIVFLASDDAGYITGHVLDVNGGMYLA